MLYQKPLLVLLDVLYVCIIRPIFAALGKSSKKTGYALMMGGYQSIYGITSIFYIDREINQRSKSHLSPTSSTPIRRRQSEASTRESTPVRTTKKHEESKVLKRVCQCALLNGLIFLVSVILFGWILRFGGYHMLQILCGTEQLDYFWPLLYSVMQGMFHVVWVVPLLLISKIINSLWFQDIADSAFRYSGGRPASMDSISKILSDALYSIIIQVLFLIQATLVRYIPIPIVARLLTYLHMSLLYSLYAFEYKWFTMGWELHRRLAFIETHWPYFFGFGLPLTVATEAFTDSYIISGCIFSTLFPFFIVSSNTANPIPSNIFPLRLFSFVVSLANFVLSKTVAQNPGPVVNPRLERATSVDSQRSFSSRSSRSATDPRSSRSSIASMQHRKR